MSRTRDLFKRAVRPTPSGAPAQRPAPENWRRQREPGEPVRTCVITFCRDEGRMLPLWVQYYGREFGVDNLYVVDDNSTDGSTDDLPCDVLRIPAIRGDFNRVRINMVSRLAQSLMQLYDVAIFCDTDEFIVPDPERWPSLKDYVETRTEEGIAAVGSIGLNVVHHVGQEPPLDLGSPLLGQRRLAKFLPLMCKPAISWVPVNWSAGTHGIRTPYEVDRDLWMFHMKFADRDLLQEAADHRLRMVQMDGRSATTQWSEGGDSLVRVVDEATTGVALDDVEEFVPPRGAELANLVVEDPTGNWRAPRGAQKTLMERSPLVRVPQRFHGRV